MSNADDASSQHRTNKFSPNPRQEKLKEFLNPRWLRAYNKSVDDPKAALNQKDIIDLSDNPRPISQAEDVDCIYHAIDMGGAIDGNIDDLNDLFNYLDPHGAGPSRLVIGKGKDINRYDEVMREDTEPSDNEASNEGEVEEEGNISDEEEVEAEDDVLSVSPLHFAMELPSPPNNPYHPRVYENEKDLYFGEDFDEDEKANVLKAREIISCADLASRLSFEEIMYLIE